MISRPGDGDAPTVPMERRDGWWHPAGRSAAGRAAARPASSTTASVLDDSDTVLPDPRSRRQPDGVHGLSRTYDPARYALGRPAVDRPPAAPAASIYELHVGTFTPEGTLAAAIDRLDHLVELGRRLRRADAGQRLQRQYDWGYDGVLWYAVHEAYGGPAALPGVRRRLPPAGPRRHPGRRLQPPRPERQLPAAVRART